MATQIENDKINKLRTDFAVMDNRLKTVDDKIEELKSTTHTNHADILQRMDNFAFTPISDHNKLQFKFEAFKDDVESNYRKKSDGQTLRNIGIAIVTAVGISFASFLLNFIINGGLRGGQ